MQAGVTRLTAAVHSLSLRAIPSGGGVSGGKLGLGVEGTWFSKFMGWTDNTSQTHSLCMANCSGHGECMNGTCFCEVTKLLRSANRV